MSTIDERGKMNWREETKRILQAELARKGVKYNDLNKRLNKIGVDATERSIATKISRGSFSFEFFLQCMKAIGSTRVTIDISEDSNLGQHRLIIAEAA